MAHRGFDRSSGDRHEKQQAMGEEGEDDDEEFRLPINHVIENSLDTDKIEMASQDKHISRSNVGFQLLMKMGWQQGKPLGKSGVGIVEPIKTEMRDVRMGLGKPEEDEYWICAENVKRKPMEAELEETEALKEKRDARAEKESKLQSELSSIKKTYYCDVCDKTYNSGAELEVHLSSYDHGHKKRFRDMKMMQQNRTSKASSAARERKEAERQRREMEKYAALCRQAESKPIQPPAAAAAAAAPAPAASTLAAVVPGKPPLVKGMKQAASFGQVKLFGSKAQGRGGGSSGGSGSGGAGGSRPRGKALAKSTLSVFSADDDDD